MSVRLMSEVWEVKLPASDKIVLLALADNANDSGVCWPGMAHLVRKCSKSDRTIQQSIKRLEAAGHLTRVHIDGKGCKYTVHPRRNFTPEETSPPKKTTQTPEESSGKPSRTIINYNIARVSKPDDVSDELWKDFKKQRKRAITETAMKGIAREAQKAGWTLSAALEEATMRGWQSFKADWVKDKTNGKSFSQGGGNGRKSARELAERLCADLPEPDASSRGQFEQLPDFSSDSNDDGYRSAGMAYSCGAQID